MLKAVLFDFDGTLADTYDIIHFAFQGIYKEFLNRSVTKQDIVALFGPPEDIIIEQQFKAHGDIKPILKHYYDLYHRHHPDYSQPQPEMLNLLKLLKRQNLKIGIITGKGNKSLQISLCHLFPDISFDVTVAGDEVETPKPHPEGLNKALHVLGCTPRDAVFIGDSDFDICAGKAVGMQTIGVTWFDPERQFQFSEKPDILVHSVADLKSHLLNMVA